jgi:hypothetical protein
MLVYKPVVKDDSPVIAAIHSHLERQPRDGFGLLHDSLRHQDKLPCGAYGASIAAWGSICLGAASAVYQTVFVCR